MQRALSCRHGKGCNASHKMLRLRVAALGPEVYHTEEDSPGHGRGFSRAAPSRQSPWEEGEHELSEEISGSSLLATSLQLIPVRKGFQQPGSQPF